MRSSLNLDRLEYCSPEPRYSTSTNLDFDPGTRTEFDALIICSLVAATSIARDSPRILGQEIITVRLFAHSASRDTKNRRPCI